MGIQIETVKTDDFSMKYFRFGNGDRTLVILPGLSIKSVMESADAVAAAYAEMTEAYTIYLFDRRKDLPPFYSVREMAQDTAAAMKKLGMKNVDLFGVSQGGMIAIEIAIDYPELVRKMVLGSSAAQTSEQADRTMRHWIELAWERDRAGLYLDFGKKLYSPETFEQYKNVLEALGRSVTPAELGRFIILTEGMKDFDERDRLVKIKCPVLVIGSEDDGVLSPESSREIVEKMGPDADCELYMYNGYGHAAFDMAPDYKQRLLKFYLV